MAVTRYAPPQSTGAAIIAAFPDRDAARRAAASLHALGLAVDVAPATSAPRWAITGMLIGGIWGMLLAALIINFLAIDPTFAESLATTTFAALGGTVAGALAAWAGGTRGGDATVYLVAREPGVASRAQLLLSSNEPEVS